jgi:hypothetical protein
MGFGFRAVLATLVAGLTVLAAGATAAVAAQTPCEVDLAGLGTASGTGVVNSAVSSCHATLDQTVSGGAQRIVGPTCAVVVTPSGRVNSICHP